LKYILFLFGWGQTSPPSRHHHVGLQALCLRGRNIPACEHTCHTRLVTPTASLHRSPLPHTQPASLRAFQYCFFAPAQIEVCRKGNSRMPLCNNHAPTHALTRKGVAHTTTAVRFSAMYLLYLCVCVRACRACVSDSCTNTRAGRVHLVTCCVISRLREPRISLACHHRHHPLHTPLTHNNRALPRRSDRAREDSIVHVDASAHSTHVEAGDRAITHPNHSACSVTSA
jgi:hypothetical protein